MDKKTTQNEMDELDLKLGHFGAIEHISRGIDKIPATAKKLSKPVAAFVLGTALALGTPAPAHGQHIDMRGKQNILNMMVNNHIETENAFTSVSRNRRNAMTQAQATSGFQDLSRTDQIRLVNQIWLDAAIEQIKSEKERDFPWFNIELDVVHAMAGDSRVGDIQLVMRVISIEHRIEETEQESQQRR